jgi:hypothetical protein
MTVAYVSFSYNATGSRFLKIDNHALYEILMLPFSEKQKQRQELLKVRAQS